MTVPWCFPDARPVSAMIELRIAVMRERGATGDEISDWLMQEAARKRRIADRYSDLERDLHARAYSEMGE
jgi:hypothetical protein